MSKWKKARARSEEFGVGTASKSTKGRQGKLKKVNTPSWRELKCHFGIEMPSKASKWSRWALSVWPSVAKIIANGLYSVHTTLQPARPPHATAAMLPVLRRLTTVWANRNTVHFFSLNRHEECLERNRKEVLGRAVGQELEPPIDFHTYPNPNFPGWKHPHARQPLRSHRRTTF